MMILERKYEIISNISRQLYVASHSKWKLCSNDNKYINRTLSGETISRMVKRRQLKGTSKL